MSGSYLRSPNGSTGAEATGRGGRPAGVLGCGETSGGALVTGAAAAADAEAGTGAGAGAIVAVGCAAGASVACVAFGDLVAGLVARFASPTTTKVPNASAAASTEIRRQRASTEDVLAGDSDASSRLSVRTYAASPRSKASTTSSIDGKRAAGSFESTRSTIAVSQIGTTSFRERMSGGVVPRIREMRLTASCPSPPGARAGEELVRNDAPRELIGARVHALAPQLLRGHEVGRSDDDAHARDRGERAGTGRNGARRLGRRRRAFGDPEVEHLHDAVVA